MSATAGNAKRLTAPFLVFGIHALDPSVQERGEMPAVADLKLRPHPVVSANDLAALRRATVAGHLPIGGRALQGIVDRNFLATGDVSACLERELVAHPEVRVAGMIAPSDHLVVFQQDVAAFTDGRAVVLRVRSRDLAQLGVIDDAERSDVFAFRYRRG